MFTIVAVVALTILSLRFLMTSCPNKINGIYCQPGPFYWVKYWVFMTILTIRQRQNRKNSTDGNTAGYGMKSRNSIEQMDRVQKLPDNEAKAVDAVYFNGGSKDGYYFVGATARRQKRLTQTILFMRIPDLGLLEIPSLPDTCLYRKNEMEYSADGFKIEPVTPMKEWKLTYAGQMRLTKTGGTVEIVDVSFSLKWSATSNYFDFDTDVNQKAMCDAIAREAWSREFFNTLKRVHQTHYEQFGEITGTVNIEKYGSRELHVQGVRDHSYGNVRDWADIHRYTIQYIQLEDGTGICCGNVCMPIMMSRLIIGYVFHPDGRCDSVSSTDIQLHQLGEDGNDPTDWSFSFVAGGKTYHTKCHVLDRPPFYMGYQWEGKLFERMCSFEVNGVKGWGISEWDYRNKAGRPEKYRKEHEP